MRAALFTLGLVAATAAHATKPTPPQQPQGLTQNVGITSIAAAAAGAFARGGSASALGGAGGSAYGGAGGLGGTSQVLGSGNGTGYGGAGGSLSLAGASIGSPTITTPKQAPGVSMTAPSQPIASCRLGLSIFGSTAGGAGGGGIPLSNDQTCLAGAKLAAMERAGGFSMESKQRVACTIEGMEELRECKALIDRRAESSPPVTASLQLLP